MQSDAILRFNFHDAERRLIVERARALTAPGRVRDQGSPVSHRGGTSLHWRQTGLSRIGYVRFGSGRATSRCCPKSHLCPRPVKTPVPLRRGFRLYWRPGPPAALALANWQTRTAASLKNTSKSSLPSPSTRLHRSAHSTLQFMTNSTTAY